MSKMGGRLLAFSFSLPLSRVPLDICVCNCRKQQSFTKFADTLTVRANRHWYEAVRCHAGNRVDFQNPCVAVGIKAQICAGDSCDSTGLTCCKHDVRQVVGQIVWRDLIAS